MGLFGTLRRSPSTAPDRKSAVSAENIRYGVSDVFIAVAEALAVAADPSAACEAAGRELARDGADLGEALSGLHATSLAVTGHEPGFSSVKALGVAWSEESLGYLHQLSCEDPLTGLASLAHLRSRLSEIYRGEERRGGRVTDGHALVVVDVPAGAGTKPFQRRLNLARIAQTLRIVFQGSETISRAGCSRLVVLVSRSTGLGRQVGLLDTLLGERCADLGAVPTWIEGLPSSDVAAGRLLDELARS